MPYICVFQVVIQDIYFTRLKFTIELIGYTIDFLVVFINFFVIYISSIQTILYIRYFANCNFVWFELCYTFANQVTILLCCFFSVSTLINSVMPKVKYKAFRLCSCWIRISGTVDVINGCRWVGVYSCFVTDIALFYKFERAVRNN